MFLFQNGKLLSGAKYDVLISGAGNQTDALTSRYVREKLNGWLERFV